MAWKPPGPGEYTIESLPCGCVITCDGDTKVMSLAPCSEKCPTLAAALQLAAERGKPVDRREC